MSMSHARNGAGTALPYGGRLMFAQSWEDPVCDSRALRPRPGDTLLAITSGGDNVLGFLLHDPARIIAIDINPLQNHLLALKCAAFRRLAHPDLLCLLGVRNGRSAHDLYQAVREELDDDVRAFWDCRAEWFRAGLLRQGAFEKYFALLRLLVRMAVGRRAVERLFTLEPAEQRRFFAEVWSTWRWRRLLRVGCSRWLLANRLDRSWFRDAAVNSFGEHFARLAEHVIADLPARTNYFLAQILLGRYLDEQAMPDYLKREHFDTIRARIGRIEPITADVGAGLAMLPDASVDAFALSNVFEYSPLPLFDACRAQIRRTARPGARVALRNLLAPRRLADDAAFDVDVGLSEALRRADRGFIYSRFEAATVRGPI